MFTARYAQTSVRWVAIVISATVLAWSAKSVRGNTPVVKSFQAAAPPESVKNVNLQYDLDPTTERFAVWTPEDYKEQEGYGLIVFISSGPTWEQLPVGWGSVLKARKLLYVSPQNCGNDQHTPRRLGMALLAAREMMMEHKIDPKRVYSAGLSGGARMAGFLGFFAPSVFHGTIQSCGGDFYQPVPDVAPRGPDDRTDTSDGYGLFHATPIEIGAAKKHVRFAIITGTHDFRHAKLLDIFHEGYEKAGFAAKLFDVPGMHHQICSGKTLASALDFIEGTTPDAAGAGSEPEKPVAPAVAAKPAESPTEHNARATAALTEAQNDIKAGRFASARALLNRVTSDYADTTAAPSAKALLQSIADQ